MTRKTIRQGEEIRFTRDLNNQEVRVGDFITYAYILYGNARFAYGYIRQIRRNDGTILIRVGGCASVPRYDGSRGWRMKYSESILKLAEFVKIDKSDLPSGVLDEFANEYDCVNR